MPPLNMRSVTLKFSVRLGRLAIVPLAGIKSDMGSGSSSGGEIDTETTRASDYIRINKIYLCNNIWGTRLPR